MIFQWPSADARIEKHGVSISHTIKLSGLTKCGSSSNHDHSRRASRDATTQSIRSNFKRAEYELNFTSLATFLYYQRLSPIPTCLSLLLFPLLVLISPVGGRAAASLKKTHPSLQKSRSVFLIPVIQGSSSFFAKREHKIRLGTRDSKTRRQRETVLLL